MANAAWSSRFVLIFGVILSIAVASCTEGVITFTGGSARVRLFNAQTKAGAVHLLVDSVRIVSALVNGAMSGEFNVPSGLYVLFEAYSADSIQQRLASQRYVMADGQSYTMILRGATITDFFRPILDTVVSPFTSKAAVKIINITEETFVTVKANDTMLGLPIVDAQTVLPFVPVETGNVRFHLLDADSGQPIGNDTTVVLNSDSCYYLFVYDERHDGKVVQRWYLRHVQ